MSDVPEKQNPPRFLGRVQAQSAEWNNGHIG
jgi:hypothetical protein